MTTRQPPPPYYVDALLSGQSWSAAPGQVATVSYAFLEADTIPDYYQAPEYADNAATFQAFNAAQRTATLEILAAWSAVADVTFVEVPAVSAQMTFGTVDLGDGIGGAAFYPGAFEGGDVWISNRYPEYFSPVPGEYAFKTFVHEIGHALGFKHSGNYDAGGNPPPLPYLPAEEDYREFTVMSYNKETTAANEPRTPVLYDIAAVQYLYGANTATNAGDTVYDLAAGGFPFQAVWDAGGVDTMDLSGFGDGQILDLNPGAFSDIDGLYNFTIAFGAVIENAVGGSGDDSLIGNEAANDLDGGAGDDILMGGGGDDTYVVDSDADQVIEGSGGGTDTVQSSLSYTLGNNVENLTLTGGANISGTGNELANVLTGTSGDDTLNGVGGNDTLTGGAGNDTLDGGDGTDVAVFSGYQADYTLTATITGGYTITDINTADGDEGTDQLTGIEALRFADIDLTVKPGGEFQVNTYTAGEQRDSSIASLSDGGFVVTWTSSGQDVDGTIASLADGGFVVTWKSNGQDGSSWGIFAQRFDADGNKVKFSISGTDGDNAITGWAGDESIDGLAGNDTLDGGDGDDTLTGGAGNDTLAGGDGDDTLDGGDNGAEGDTVSCFDASDGVTVDLSTNQAFSTAPLDAAGIGDDTLFGIENIEGSYYDDILIGDAGANFLIGYFGNDQNQVCPSLQLTYVITFGHGKRKISCPWG